jgi:phenylalanine-4-hydroxylase
MLMTKDHYTEQEHAIWTVLYTRLLQFLPETADKVVFEAIQKLGYPADRVPDLEEVNSKLSAITDWTVVPLEDMVEDNEFIAMLAEKKYPCRTWLRTKEQLDNDIDEYDMFHDIIGHTPLLTIPAYSNYLTGIGKLALENLNNKTAISLLKKVYWHSIQFGIIATEHTLKIYGAHLLSSRGETIFSISAGVPKYDLNVGIMMDTPYKKGSYQEKYFVINSYDDLYNSLGTIKDELAKRI